MSHDLKGIRFCDGCGADMEKAHRVENDKEYCATCYPKVFLKATCSRCGASARVMRNCTTPVCKACERFDRSCLRCDRPLPKASLRVGNRYVCGSCAPIFREQKACAGCGALSGKLSVPSTHPSMGAVCESCRNAINHQTCTVCRKYRKVATTIEGKPFCADCIPGKERSHLCPGCGRPVPGAGVARCLHCLNRDSTHRSAAVTAAALGQQWSKDLLLSYADWLCATKPDKPALHLLFNKHCPFFERLDACFDSRAAVTRTELATRFGTPYLRTYLLASRFVLGSREDGKAADASAQEVKAITERLRVDRMLASAGQTKHQAVLEAFVQSLETREIKDLTKRLYVRAAETYIQHHMPDSGQPTNASIARFCKRFPGHRNSLGSFLTFGALRFNWKAKLPKREAPKRWPTTVTRIQRLLEGGVSAATDHELMKVLLIAHGLRIGAGNGWQVMHGATGLQICPIGHQSEPIVVALEFVSIAEELMRRR